MVMKQMNSKICQLKDNKVGENFTYVAPLNMYGAKVGDDITVGAGSVVTKDLKEPGIYAGNPARRIK